MVVERRDDLCPRCGGTLLADYDLDLRCQMPFCLCCGFKRYTRRAVSPLIVVAKPDDLLTANDVADEFGFSRDAVFKVVACGKLSPVDATAYRHQYRRSDIDAWRASGQVASQRAEATKRANKAKREVNDGNDCD